MLPQMQMIMTLLMVDGRREGDQRLPELPPQAWGQLVDCGLIRCTPDDKVAKAHAAHLDGKIATLTFADARTPPDSTASDLTIGWITINPSAASSAGSESHQQVDAYHSSSVLFQNR